VSLLIHLDTDLGSDPDDGCALAMLLGWPDVELVAVTTTADPGGRRAGYVEHCLRLAGRTDIPVLAGAGSSLTTGRRGEVSDRYWPAGVPARPAPPGAALDLLDYSVSAGATVVAIGPYTNLALLETLRPGTLARTRVVVMGGWVDPPADGLPPWGPERDTNVQWDTRAARIVAAAATDLTLATLPVTLRAQLRAADLPRLRACGGLGRLLAEQSQAHAVDSGKAALGVAHPGLPDDLLNFHYDPVACAVAVGWPGAPVGRRTLTPARDEAGVLRFVDDPAGRPVSVVTDVDGAAFTEAWLSALAAAARP
jgi:inosine-uridine nucleoside N-ribohydrolase